MGASTALALTDRGHSVTLLDQFEPGHRQGSSHGNSRIVRSAYPDPFYEEIMLDAYRHWSRLNERFGGGLHYESGLIYAGHRESINLRTMRDGLDALGAPYEVLLPADLQRVFPAFQLAADEIAVYERRAGWVNAHVAVSASVKMAESQGAQFVKTRIEDPGELLREFDAVCLCMGAWVKDHVAVDAEVICQTFGYLDVDQPDQHGPVWIEDYEHEIYGFPPEPGRNQIKFGVHSPGPTIHPDQRERPVTEEKIELLKDFARRRLGVENPVIKEPTACLYTKTRDNDFRFGEVRPGMFYASPCSGHGFKFGPWVGHLMADFVEQRKHPSDFPRFQVRSSQP